MEDGDHHERVPLTNGGDDGDGDSGRPRSRSRRRKVFSNIDDRRCYYDDEDSTGPTSTTSTTFEISHPSSSSSRSTGGGIFGGGLLCCAPCFDGWGCSDNILTDCTKDILNNRTNGSTTRLIHGHAFDIIIVQNTDTGELFQNSDFTVLFPGVSLSSSGTGSTTDARSSSISPPTQSAAEESDGDGIATKNRRRRQRCRPEGDKSRHSVVLELQYRTVDSHNSSRGRIVWFPIRSKTSLDNHDSGSTDFDGEDFWGCCHPDAGFVPPSELSSSGGSDYGESFQNEIDPTMALAPYLQPGENSVRYLLLDDTTIVGVADASIFLWGHTDQLIICDIDGTITKSNARGVIDTLVTKRYRHCHDGICRLFSSLVHPNSAGEVCRNRSSENDRLKPGPTRRILYVTARPLTLVNPTRSFLSSLTQGDWSLPNGPVLGFNGSLLKIGLMEAITKTTHHFKADTILRNVIEPFQRATMSFTNLDDKTSTGINCSSFSSSAPVLLAGFGNTLMDIVAYHAVGVHVDRLFMINKESKIVSFDKSDTQFGQMRATNSIETVRIGGLSFTVTFRHQDWYQQRIGRTFDGYGDKELISRLQSVRYNKDDDTLSVTDDL